MDQTLRNNLRFSINDALFYSLMVGLAENYIAAYVISKGFSEISTSLIATLPLLFGGILQLISPFMVKSLGSYKKFVLLSASLQGFSLLFLSLTTFCSTSIFLLFLIATLYWGSAMAAGPAWNTWVNTLIPSYIRTVFFSRRSQLIHVATFVGLLVAGLFLDRNGKSSHELFVYFLIFFTGSVLRFISVYWLSRQSELKSSGLEIQTDQYRELFKKTLKSKYGQLLFFMFLFQIGCYISIGFFTPLMLKELNFSYSQYLFLIATSLLTRVTMLQFAGRFFKPKNFYKLLLLAVIGIVPSPFFWSISQNILWLFFQQILSGTFWGIFDLITFLILFNDIPSKERPSVLSFYNFFQSGGIFIGSLIGAGIFYIAGGHMLSYDFVFYASTLVRALALLAFPGILSFVFQLNNPFHFSRSFFHWPRH